MDLGLGWWMEDDDRADAFGAVLQGWVGDSGEPRAKGENPRRLTPRECARLMGFPDSFRIPVSDTQAYKQFGNSVAVPVVADGGAGDAALGCRAAT
jgi:hypothetical protein